MLLILSETANIINNNITFHVAWNARESFHFKRYHELGNESLYGIGLNDNHN